MWNGDEKAVVTQLGNLAFISRRIWPGRTLDGGLRDILGDFVTTGELASRQHRLGVAGQFTSTLLTS